MNEQIREHVRASGIDVYGLGLDREKWEATVERFAELIVRECATIAKTAEPWRSDDLILKHFGLHDEG